MLQNIIALFIPITAIVSLAVIAIYFRRYHNNERMALIERGVNIYADRPKKNKSYEGFKAGLFFVGIGLGFLTGYFLEASTGMEVLAYFIMLFIFGGLGLVVGHIVVNRLAKKDESEVAKN